MNRNFSRTSSIITEKHAETHQGYLEGCLPDQLSHLVALKIECKYPFQKKSFSEEQFCQRSDSLGKWMQSKSSKN